MNLTLITGYLTWRVQRQINKPYIRKILYQVLLEVFGYIKKVELSILLTDDNTSKDLNARYRNKVKATNVLSFPAANISPDNYLGDLVFAYQTIDHESLNSSFINHFTHLLVHGSLHLLGYSHEEEMQASIMEELEIKILASLSINNPYL